MRAITKKPFFVTWGLNRTQCLSPYTHTHTHTHIYIYIYIYKRIDVSLPLSGNKLLNSLTLNANKEHRYIEFLSSIYIYI